MPICLGEIERCQKVTPRPNFVVLLGDRYGWRPLPPEIPAKEFTEIEAKVTAADDDKARLETWYQLDENAAPPVWSLQPRHVDEKANSEVRKATEREAAEWTTTEARLHAILSAAIAAAGFGEDARVRYEASATEQEILRGALQVPDAADHVLCFFRTLEAAPGVDLAKSDPTDIAVADFLDGTKTDGRFTLDASRTIDRRRSRSASSARSLATTSTTTAPARRPRGSAPTISARCTGWLGQVVDCPRPDCEGHMRINPFVTKLKVWNLPR